MQISYRMISTLFCIAFVGIVQASDISRSNPSLTHEQVNLDVAPSLTKQGLLIPWGAIGGSIALYTGWKAIKYGWQRYWRCPDLTQPMSVKKYGPIKPVMPSLEAKEAVRKSSEKKYKEDYIAATNALLRQENWWKLAARNGEQTKVAIDAAGTQFIDLNDKAAQYPESYVEGMKAKIEQFSNENRNTIADASTKLDGDAYDAIPYTTHRAYEEDMYDELYFWDKNTDAICPKNEDEHIQLISELFKNNQESLDTILTNDHLRFHNVVYDIGQYKNIQFSILGTNKGISTFGVTWSKPFWHYKNYYLHGNWYRNYGHLYKENDLLSEPYYQHKIFPQASRVYFDAYYDLYRNKGGQRIYDRRFPKSVNKSAEDL